MKRPYLLLIATLVVVIILTLLLWRNHGPEAVVQTPQDQESAQGEISPDQEKDQQSPGAVAEPLGRSTERITKKPFGIYITPQNSPVSPEKFSGYHTGTDFEILAGEETADVPFFAICTGEVKQIRTASGYGGLLTQACEVNSGRVIVIYGHIDIGSVAKKVGETVEQGEQIGILGQPPAETDGERKHLHLGIHKGNSINIRGYVQTESELSAWLDYQSLIPN